MKKIILAVCVVFLTTFSIYPVPIAIGTGKYSVYFKDKGIVKQTSLQKNSPAYNEAVQSLSERSIQRRKKHLGEENFIIIQIKIFSIFIMKTI
ncbi:MAG: hypothetical protein WC557_01485 [Ignavibacteriaceae bacterium]